MCLGCCYFLWLQSWAESLKSYSPVAAAAKSLQSHPTLWDPVDGSPPSSPIPGILQSRILEWVAISSSNAWKWKVKVKLLSCVRLFATPWTAAHQAPPSVGFSRQEYWSGVHRLLRNSSVTFSCSHHAVWEILVPQPGTEPGWSLAVKAPSPNHWTIRKFSIPI